MKEREREIRGWQNIPSSAEYFCENKNSKIPFLPIRLFLHFFIAHITSFLPYFNKFSKIGNYTTTWQMGRRYSSVEECKKITKSQRIQGSLYCPDKVLKMYNVWPWQSFKKVQVERGRHSSSAEECEKINAEPNDPVFGPKPGST